MEQYFTLIHGYYGESFYEQLFNHFAANSTLYADSLRINEWHIYGSSRLGVYETNSILAYRTVRDQDQNNIITPNEYTTGGITNVSMLFGAFSSYRGNKRYEMSNHLGNVLTVITDRKIAVCSTGVFSYFKAEVISATDYSPFGAPMVSRTYQASEYRFSFNGQERDDEVSGVGNTMTAEFWEYDARLGRRWNRDPKSNIEMSPFSCFGNSPILFNDAKGDIFRISKGSDGKTNQKAQTDIENLANKNNRQFISFNENGIASLNFGPRTTEEIDELLANDKGLNLINTLINAKNKDGKDLTFQYDVCDENLELDKETGEIITEKYNIDKNGNQSRIISNLSTSARNINGGIGGESRNPIDGIDGFVRISPGSFSQFNNSQLIINRSSMVYHELMENYARTALGLPYVGPKDGSNATIGPQGFRGYGGAHNYSINSEGQYYGNPFPGGYGGFDHE
jgi:hypothetical protein